MHCKYSLFRLQYNEYVNPLSNLFWLFLVSEGDLSTVFPYIKPQKRLEPKFEPPVSSKNIKLQNDSPGVAKAKAVELANVLVRIGHHKSHEQSTMNVPSWGPFHPTMESEILTSLSTVAFNPTLIAKPTDSVLCTQP